MGKGASARRGAPVLLGRAQPHPGPPRARLTGSRTMPAKAGGSQERRKGRLVSRPGAGSGQERRAVPGGGSGEAGGLRAETRREESSVKSVPDGRLGSTARVSSVGVRTRSPADPGDGRHREKAPRAGAGVWGVLRGASPVPTLPPASFTLGSVPARRVRAQGQPWG